MSLLGTLPKRNITGTALWSDIETNDEALRGIIDGNIENVNVKSSAAISYSKLASAATGSALIGNGGTPTMTALTGDVTVGATGVTAIGASKVTSAMILNGEIVSADLNAAAGVTDAQLASPNNGAYKTLFSTQTYAGGSTTGTYYVPTGAGVLLASTGISTVPGSQAPPIINLYSSDYAVTGKTTKLRVDTTVAVGSTAPSTVTLKCGLFPLTISAGNWALRAVAVDGLQSFSLATNSILTFAGSDVNIPADGAYVLGCVVGSITCPVGIHIGAKLMVRNN